MFNVGEDVFHGPRDDPRLVVVSRLVKGIKRSALLSEQTTKNWTHQGERLSGSGLPVGKHNRIVTLHSGNDVISRDFVIYGFILGTGDEFIKMKFWRSGAGGFCVLRVEFDGLCARR